MLLEKILEDLGDIKSCRKITIEELQNLGYKLSDRKLVISKNEEEETPAFFVLELLNMDDNKIVSFCYLFVVNKKVGVILGNPYDYYLSMLEPES